MEFYKIKLQMIKQDNVRITDKTMTNAIDIIDFINSIEGYDKAINENVIVIMLNTKNKIIAYSEIGIGANNNCYIDIPSIFKTLFTTNTSKFILAHNHPSGDATPSKEDIATTKKIKEVSELMGVQFLDHIIIGENEYKSIMKEVK